MGGEEREEHWATGTILSSGLGGETDGPMGGRDEGQEPIRGRQGDLPTPGLAMIENHDPPLGKEQLDIRSRGKTLLGLKYDIARSRKPLT